MLLGAKEAVKFLVTKPWTTMVPHSLNATPVVQQVRTQVGVGGAGIKAMAGVITGKRRFRMIPVEQDPHKLCNYLCGSNINVDDPEPIKLGKDEDYPDWIWDLNLGKPIPSHEMDPNTKDYWIQQHKENILRIRRLERVKPMPKIVTWRLDRWKIQYRHRLRFRALAGDFFDPGLDVEAIEHDWRRFQRLTPDPGKLYLPCTEKEEYHPY